MTDLWYENCPKWPFDCGYPRERGGDKLVDNSLYTRKKIKNSPKNGQLTNISVWT
jgi:hypothetical protein